ncbi:MAG TPA: NAD(P)-dependent oxidoreductase [Bryobacteraceae bacterium]
MTTPLHIVVTGGAGYVGSTLVPLLLGEGHKVTVYDVLLHGGHSLLSSWNHPNFDFVHADIRDHRTLSSALREVDAVVHLAAIVGDPACSRQPEEAREINLGGSLELLEQCHRAGVSRLVFASTCSNYGKMANPDAYVDESSTLAPVSLYAETKVQFEKTLLELSASDKLCVTPLRFATVYGVSPRMRFDLTVNEFTMDMLIKKHLVVFGEHFWRPYIHVRDAAAAIAAVLQADTNTLRSQVFNVGSTDQNYRKLDLVNLIRSQAPYATVQYVHKQEDPRDYRVSFSKIASVLGFQTTRTVEDGIREVARLVRSGVLHSFDDPVFRN